MKTLKYILVIVFAFFINQNFAIANESTAQESEGEHHEEKMTDVILHHISDAHSWELPTFGKEHKSLSLPIILWDNGLHMFSSSALAHDAVVESNGQYYKMEHEVIYKSDASGTITKNAKHVPTNAKPLDFSITKNVASLFFSVILLLIILLTVAKTYKENGALKAPKGLQAFVEPLIIFVRDEVAIPNIGHAKYAKYMPYLLTIFFFILINNLLGLIPFIPGGANLSGNLAFTGVLAVITFLIFTFAGNKNYWQHILWMPGVPVFVKPILTVVEFVGMFVKPASLAIRLFANITGGHILVLSIVTLGIVFKSYMVGGVSVLFTVFISLIEILVAFLQAFIFTLLTSIYIGQATEESDHH